MGDITFDDLTGSTKKYILVVSINISHLLQSWFIMTAKVALHQTFLTVFFIFKYQLGHMFFSVPTLV